MKKLPQKTATKSPMASPKSSIARPVNWSLESGYLKVKIDGSEIPKGRLVKGPYKPICGDCAIYISTTVFGQVRCDSSKNLSFNASDFKIKVNFSIKLLTFEPKI